jgi:hypothetical protein
MCQLNGTDLRQRLNREAQARHGRFARPRVARV